MSTAPDPLSTAPAERPQDPAAGAGHRWFIKSLCGLIFLLVGSWIVGGMFVLEWGRAGATPDPRDVQALHPSEHPWGELIYVPLAIAPPDELIPDLDPENSEPLKWRFPRISQPQLVEEVAAMKLSPAVASAVLSLAEPDAQINGFTVSPGREFVLDLSPEDRANLYVTLSAFPDENQDQRDAFRYGGHSVDEWLANEPLSAKTVELVRRTVYRNRGHLFFADLRSIAPLLPSADERLRLIRALSRQATFRVMLHVPLGANVASLANYWGRGGHKKDVRPLLEALSRSEGGQSIDLVHLLPTFARDRLFTFPLPSEQGAALKRDCHWSTMNFFAAQPDDRFGDAAEILRTLDADYYRVFGDLELGDLVFYCVNEIVLHSAVYIADDFVFTKNGPTCTQPWMFMKLGEMRTFYPAAKPLEVRYYRRKEI